MDEIILRYVGEGAFFPGVPTRDLSEQDVEECGKSIDDLLASEMYIFPEDEEGEKK